MEGVEFIFVQNPGLSEYHCMAGRGFESIPDPVNHRGFPLRDCLLSEIVAVLSQADLAPAI